ncbi:MAG: choice-of-anchor L domain-containing protein [candidate division Zixibacteria bacterium]|nr:choice-of-anchor L domain-containing protein [candidate division Zixibacteria bacterium]
MTLLCVGGLSLAGARTASEPGPAKADGSNQQQDPSRSSRAHAISRSRPPHDARSADIEALVTSDLTSGLTAADVVGTLVGDTSISISNVHYSGTGTALGTFSGGSGIIGFENGIILSTGAIASVIGPNVDSNTTTRYGGAGDDDLDALIQGSSTLDAAVLEFDFECANIRTIAFEYVFASEEYNEYVNDKYNDVFGFFVNGANIALLPDGITPVSINTVNGGNPFGTNAHNANFYRNNDCFDGGCTINTEMDGLTLVLTASAPVRPGLNHIKLAIADVADDQWDSDVFIRARSLICGSIQDSVPVCVLDPPGPFDANVGRPMAFVISGADPDTGNTITLSTPRLPPGATMTPALPVSGPNTGVSSQFDWTPTQQGTFAVDFRLADDRGRSDTCQQFIVVREGVPPCVTKTIPSPATVDVDHCVAGFCSFSEPVVIRSPETEILVHSLRNDTIPVYTSIGPDYIYVYSCLPRPARYPCGCNTSDVQTESVDPLGDGGCAGIWPPDDTVEIRISATITDTAGNPLDGNCDGIAQGSPADDFILTFTTSPAVLPGDANHDGRVDERDILPLAAYWLKRGPSRFGLYATWEPQLACPWAPREATYADCDGNGIVDSADICPIAEFFDRAFAAKRDAIGPGPEYLSVLGNDVAAALSQALLNCPTTNPAGRAALQSWLESQTRTSTTVPRGFHLAQNYPNPFNAATIIDYSLGRDAKVRLEIVDPLGRHVATLVDQMQTAGDHQVQWDGTDGSGHSAASGTYFYRLTAGELTEARAMVLLR